MKSNSNYGVPGVSRATPEYVSAPGPVGQILPAHALPPSKRRRPVWRKVGDGLISLWRVSSHLSPDSWAVHGYYKDEEQAFAEADTVWATNRRNKSVRVEHKAGVEVNGKVYVCNVLPIVLSDQT